MWCVVLFITKRGRAGTLAVQILLHAGLFCCERVEAWERQVAADAGAEVLEGRDEGGQELVVQVGVPQALHRGRVVLFPMCRGPLPLSPPPCAHHRRRRTRSSPRPTALSPPSPA